MATYKKVQVNIEYPGMVSGGRQQVGTVTENILECPSNTFELMRIMWHQT